MRDGVGGLGACRLVGALGGVARGDHGLERLALMLHVLARHVDEVGDQVVAALELHVDLREGVGDLVAAAHQAVVGRRAATGPA